MSKTVFTYKGNKELVGVRFPGMKEDVIFERGVPVEVPDEYAAGFHADPNFVAKAASAKSKAKPKAKKKGSAE